PDGSKIAFVSERARPNAYFASSDIFVMDVDGKNVKRLTTTSNVNDHPTWSPDGTRIAFDADLVSGPRQIFTVSSDGSGLKKLSAGGDDSHPSYSPDGTLIAYQGSNNGTVLADDPDDGTTQLYMMGADGSNVTKITSSHTNNCVVCASDPSWAADGSGIYYIDNHLYTEGFIRRIGENGSYGDVTTSANGYSGPVSSPDASLIAVASANHAEITTMTNSGSSPFSVTGHQAGVINESPSWQLAPWTRVVTMTKSTKGFTGSVSSVMPYCFQSRSVLLESVTKKGNVQVAKASSDI